MRKIHLCLPAALLLVAVFATSAGHAAPKPHNCTRGKSVFEFTKLPDHVKVEATKGAKQVSRTKITMARCDQRALKGGLKFRWHHNNAPTGAYVIGYASRHACLCYSHGEIRGTVAGERIHQLFHISKGSLDRDPLKLTREGAKALNEALGRKKHGPFDDRKDRTIGRVTSAWAEF